jgi:hypothetical protein
MKNTIKLLGVAIAVLLTFGLVGCGPVDEEVNLEPVYIDAVAGEGGYVYVGATLTAVYTGSEDVTYQWKYKAFDFDGQYADADGAATDITYTASKPGIYIVTVSYKEANPVNSLGQSVYKEPDPSNPNDPDTPPPIDITSPHAVFYGTWEYNPDHELSDNTTAARKKLRATITVREDEFKINDNDGDYLIFTITTWTEKTNEGHGNGDTGAYARSKYEAEFPDGYELTGTTDKSKGSYGKPTKVTLYINGAKDAIVRVSYANNTYPIVSCVYEKVEATE